MPQILAVLEGEGSIAGADGRFVPVAVGEAVFWAAGEEHETRTETGLTALVLEAEGLRVHVLRRERPTDLADSDAG